MNSEGVSNHCSAQAKAYSFQLSFAQESWPRSWSRWPEGLADSVYLLWLVMTVHYVNVEIICRNQEKLWGMKMMLKRAIMQRRSKHILSLLWMRLALVFNFEWIPSWTTSRPQSWMIRRHNARIGSLNLLLKGYSSQYIGRSSSVKA